MRNDAFGVAEWPKASTAVLRERVRLVSTVAGGVSRDGPAEASEVVWVRPDMPEG